jgi:hypothetical protein
MEPDLNEKRRRAHALLDMLPVRQLKAVRDLLEVMVDPVGRPPAGGEGTPHEEISHGWQSHR